MGQDTVGTDDYQNGAPSVKSGYNPFITKESAAAAKNEAMAKPATSPVPQSKKIYGGQNGY